MVNRKDLTLIVLGEKTREELPVRSRDLVYVSHDPLQPRLVGCHDIMIVK